jgi:predicted amidohydrolase YtcJ
MSSKSRCLTVAFLVATGAASDSPSQTSPPDAIFIGRFVTLDPSRPRAEALAVANGRIVAVGPRAEVERLAAPATRRIEIPGVALPGFADAHAHVSSVGRQLERLDLRGLSKEQFLAKVAEAVRTTPKGGWISGGGWDEGFWKPVAFPTAAELDTVARDHLVVLSRIDGHSMVVNSRVLALAGINRNTPDPNGGRIHRDASGEPTGMLVDRAKDAVSRVIPDPTPSQREKTIRAALQQYARWGVTSVHDAGTDLDTIAIYKDLLRRGELSTRMYVMARGEKATAHYLARGPEKGLGDGRLSVRSFKIGLDGALGSRGAEMSEPYSDAPGERGLRLMEDAALDTLVRAAREKGFQVSAHAIGDKAVARALDAFERGGVTPDQRFRIEHASVVAPQDEPRFKRQGVIASMQPVFVGEYSRWSEDRVGAARLHWVLPTRDLMASGAVVASGTDYPASDSGDPIHTLYGLVTRKSAGGEPPDGWLVEQRVDVEAALRSMSEGPAFAAFQEKDLGRLTVGRYADFTVVSSDPYEVPAEDLRKLAVGMTVVAGKVVFESREGDSRSR